MADFTIENMMDVIAYIESHLDEKLTLDMLADAMHYSKYHLHRMFTGTVRLTIHDYIQRRQLTEAAKLLVFSDKPIIEIALIAGYEGPAAVGAMAFSYETGSIDFMGVHPQYRGRGIQKLFLTRLMEDLLPKREISITTYRQGDRADTGHRGELLQLGFAERELLVEFGYPTQRFVLHPNP